jgi:hypothetical protein
MRLRRNKAQMIGQDMRNKTVLTIQERIKEAFRRGDWIALHRQFNTLLAFNTSMPVPFQLSALQLLNVLPPTLRSETKLELCKALGIDEHGIEVSTDE